MNDRRRRARRTMDRLLIFIGVMSTLQWVVVATIAWSLYDHINTPYADPASQPTVPSHSVPVLEPGTTEVV